MSTDRRYGVRTGGFDDLDSRTAYLLWKLRADVFVVEQASIFADLDGLDLEPSTVHVWAMVDADAAGYLRVLDDGGELAVGRVVVATGHRGRGLAQALMDAALEIVGDRPSHLWAQEGLEGWYGRYGYVRTGEPEDDADILHVPMRRA